MYCFLRGLWWSVSKMMPFSGHVFVEEEKHKNVTVTIGKCEECGKVDISWSKF